MLIDYITTVIPSVFWEATNTFGNQELFNIFQVNSINFMLTIWGKLNYSLSGNIRINEADKFIMWISDTSKPTTNSIDTVLCRKIIA
jgi:hypothetical protein